MFFDDAKKAVTVIMAKRKPSGEKTMDNVPMMPQETKTEDGEIDGRHVAAQDLIGAFHEKSPQKLMQALAHFIDIHHAK